LSIGIGQVYTEQLAESRRKVKNRNLSRKHAVLERWTRGDE
jgi:hypothetical protein